MHTTRTSIQMVILSAVILLMLWPFTSLKAQPLPCPPYRSTEMKIGNDTVLCLGSCMQLAPKKLTTNLKSTAAYKLDRITYSPYAFNGGTPVLTNMDDIWSDEIPLPFEFCFFGKKYQSCVIGANGNISFNSALANVSQPYAVHPAPFNGICYNNCIMGAYYDVNPAKGGQISYSVYGAAPCRTFVVSWENIPLYECDWMKGTQQIVLYESTYAIEVFIRDKPICYAWEDGNGVLGIQNEDATNAYIFSDRNSVPWADTNAGYRFTPDGSPDISYKWINLTTGLTIARKDTVTICPKVSGTYRFEATLLSQCDALVVADTMDVNVMYYPSVADFGYALRYGCTMDTLIGANLSTFSKIPVRGPRFYWEFGDGTADTAKHPVHVYTRQGTYKVSLTTRGDSVCAGSVTKEVTTTHALKAAFTPDKDTLCGKGLVNFTDRSDVANLYGGGTSYKWLYNDGLSDDGISDPAHYFSDPGLYVVLQIVGDAIPCYDTTYRIIRIDSLPQVNVIAGDTLLCTGEELSLQGIVSRDGLRRIEWSFGDGSLSSNVLATHHVYERAGKYTISLLAHYAVCPDAVYEQDITVNPTPVVYLGPDTSLCPGMGTILLTDIAGRDTAGMTRLWSTGEKTAGIRVSRTGEYRLKVTANGCSAYDTVNVTKGCYISIPNAFSPNGDGENDRYLPLDLLSEGITDYEMQIFNRWGQLVYHSTRNDSPGWDGTYSGTEQPLGVYIYTIHARFANGEEQQYRGNLTLLR